MTIPAAGKFPVDERIHHRPWHPFARIAACEGGAPRRHSHTGATAGANRPASPSEPRSIVTFFTIGFTLIELMIVLAIVGVIAAYAIPSYQDYLARSRVGEGLSLAASARLTVAESAAGGAALDSGYHSPPATRNVDSIEIDPENGQITIAYTTRIAPAGQNTLVLVPSAPDDPDQPTGRATLTAGSLPAGPLTWECFAAGKAASTLPEPGPAPADAPTLPSRLAMPDCR